MSEHTDLLPLRSPEEGGPAFELVRRGYDRDQVENHLGWLEDQLRNTEIARDAAEQAAATAAAEAEAAREELERGRPQWHELGDRITQILTLAEEEASEIRAQRAREADELLTGARQSAADADRIHGARVREAETQAEQVLSVAQAEAEQTMTTAQAEADRILVRAQQQAAEEERAAARRLADLERQRDAVNAQLSRLHEALAAALAPAISIDESYDAGDPPAAPRASLAEQSGYEQEYEGGYEDDAYAGSSSKDARFRK
jgi:cell division septum initiation protein DivIVA